MYEIVKAEFHALTSAIGVSQPHDLASLPFGKEILANIRYEDQQAPEPVLMLRKREKSLPCQDLSPGHPAHGQSLHQATPAPTLT